MKKSILVVAILFLFVGTAFAGWVNGYYRANGTWVSGHYRSEPNNTKSDNYGPSKSTFDVYNPESRDADGDGIANMYDNDDDNDGIHDDYDSSQY